MSKRKFSISFKRKFNNVFVYLNHLKDNHENVSDYICKLIEADMKKEHASSSMIQDEVRKIVLETLLSGNHNILPLPDNKALLSNNAIQRNEDIDLLNQLF